MRDINANHYFDIQGLDEILDEEISDRYNRKADLKIVPLGEVL